MKNLNGSENRIIFKINENAFTLFDLEKRIEYLDFVGNNNNIDKNIIIEDFISATIFYEYYILSGNDRNYNSKVEEIYKNILSTNQQNNKIYTYNINKRNIFNNIKIDFIRKTILENMLNSSIGNINTSKEEIDLLYKFKIKYLNFQSNNVENLKNEISNLEDVNFIKIQNLLEINDIQYFIKENEINNINKINQTIRNNILSNNNYFIIEKNNNVTIVFIEKNFETFVGIILNLYSIRSKEFLDKEFLKCENLVKLDENPNIINKDYKLIDLNDDLKNNLINVNDYVKYINNDENVYIILCNIKFDEQILNNININKLINSNVNEIEKKFISKYSKIFNLIKLYE